MTTNGKSMNDYIRMSLLETQNAILKTENEKLKAQLDYVSMMTDVDIPTEDEDETFPEV